MSKPAASGIGAYRVATGLTAARQYEQLVKDRWLILQLHGFEVGPIGNRADRPYGNSVLLWFEATSTP